LRGEEGQEGGNNLYKKAGVEEGERNDAKEEAKITLEFVVPQIKI